VMMAARALGNVVLATATEGAVVLTVGKLGEMVLPGRGAAVVVIPASTAMPLPWQVGKHVVLLLVAREILAYHFHRYLLHSSSSSSSSHSSRSSTLLTRLHAGYAHSQPQRAPSASITALADHPLPYLVHRTLPLLLPALVVNPHLLTYFLFVAICTLEETLVTSGYTIVPGIIMSGMVRRSAVHYASGGKGNFGPVGVVDWCYGTGCGGDILGDVRAEAEKHKVRQKAEGVRRRSERLRGKKE
jgi:hypothetical protein